jgi:tRNA dimethylallyltransferase
MPLSDNGPLIVLTGPTGAGKSAIAARAAARIRAEVICADSRQLFKGLPVCTAQPDEDEMRMAPHHLYAILDPAFPVSAGAYREIALPVIDAIRARGSLPMVTGGTGLYIRALLHTISLAPPVSPGILEQLCRRLQHEGCLALHRELARIDPDASFRIKPQDGYRITRALAVWQESGRRMSEWRKDLPSPFVRLAHIAIGLPRSVLHERINERCRRMFALGVLDEARTLRSCGLSPDLPSLKAIGYRALCAVIDGTMTESEALALMQRDSRRYAKRQMTWLRAQPGIVWVDATDREAAVDRVCELASQLMDTREHANAI